MYNITNIIATFCKVYLRLYPYFSCIHSGYALILMFILLLFLYIRPLYVHIPYLE